MVISIVLLAAGLHDPRPQLSTTSSLFLRFYVGQEVDVRVEYVDLGQETRYRFGMIFNFAHYVI